ncbi:MAG: WbqC family protein [Saprospiraceae bacterium]|nr:WbqC family protein [Saprospiraceae bacterium]
MKIGIHQPNFIPWLGYFHKISLVDTFILYDTAQYTKNSFINRNKLVINNLPRWTTIPVLYKGFSHLKINEIRIDHERFNPEKILKTIRQEYSKYPYFENYFNQFEKILWLATEHQSLSQLNENLIRWVCDKLNIKTRLINASSLPVHGSNTTERIVEMCKYCGGKFYFSGSGGKKYLKEELFEEEGIKLEYFDNTQVIKKYDDLSVLHWIFKEGKEVQLSRNSLK